MSSGKKGTRRVRLTSPQEALWLAEQMNPDTSLRNVFGAWELTGPIDLVRLREALEEVVRRHPVMRASIEVVDGMPFQVVADDGEVPLQILDCSLGAERETCDDAMRQIVSSVLHRTFDLGSGPLARVVLVRRDNVHGILCVAAHHIIWDGLSTDVFAREMSSCYASVLCDTAHEPGDTGTSFLDLAAEAADGLSSAQENDLKWWKETLTPLPDALVLPSRLTPAGGPVNAMAVSSVVDGELLARVRQISRAQHATHFMTTFAAFAALLFRLTGQEDMMVAVPVSGRTGPDAERMIGLFVGTLPIRVSVRPTECLSDLIRRVRGATLDAMGHQALPYPALVRDLAPERHEATDPLCQVAFQLRRHITGLLVFPGVRVGEYDVDAPASAYGLTMTIDDRGESMICSVSFEPAVLDVVMVQHLLKRYETLLDTMTRVPGTLLRDINLLDEGEEGLMLDEWGGRRRSGSVPGLTVHAMVEARASAHPDAVAVEEGDAALTYGEFDAKADRLALSLRAHGVAHGTVVGLLMGRSTLAVIAMLATLKAGAAYMPMDPDYPPARLSAMVRVGRPALVLALVPHADLMGGTPVMVLDTFFADVAPPSSSESEGEGSVPEDPAYVIFTSGSTGEPKGVVVPHRGIVQLVSDHDYWDGDERDSVAHLSTIAFDAATFEVWGALCRGARLVVIDRVTVLSPDMLALALERHGVTTAFLTTSLFNVVVRRTPGLLSHLRVVLFGGEMADAAAVRFLLASGPPSRLLHVYGPTETTTFALWYEVHVVPDPAVTVPVGRPLAGATAYVVDSVGQLAAPGMTGELCIGGSGVALGYAGDEQLTSERFLPDPWATARGGRLYRTGDRAVWDSGGNLELKGRLDSQIKLRGFRIEPGEIVAALERQENVEQAAAIVREDQPGDRRLVSYVVSADGRPLPIREILAALAELLPSFMVPSACVQVPFLPMTVAGKLDVGALPAPGLPARAEAPAEPSSDVERLLAEVWRHVLGLERVGIDDDFFELGGHSLTAVRLVAEVERLMGTRIPMSTLFDAPTIRRLARLLSSDSWSPRWNCLVPIHTKGSLPPVFCVHGSGNEVLWLSGMSRELGGEQPFYGLQALGLDGRTQPLHRIEDMAARYIDEILQIFPQGPYYLLGYSLGGAVAFEMAHQLYERGCRVAFLGLIDSGFPGASGDRGVSLLTRLKLHAQAMASRGTVGAVRYAGHRARSLWRRICASWVPRVEIGRQTDLDSRTAVARRVEAAGMESWRNYVPAVWHGGLTYFASTDRGETIWPDSRLRWHVVAPEAMNVVRVRGTHLGMLEGAGLVELAAAVRTGLHIARDRDARGH